MLYDPKWESPTKSDPLSLDTLIAWLEKQSPNATYCYLSKTDCLLCHYFEAMGFSGIVMDQVGFHHREGHHRLPTWWDSIASAIHPRFTYSVPWRRTYGAALERAQWVKAHA